MIERDAEFILSRAGRDVLVRTRIDIGICPLGNWRAQILRASDPIVVLQLRFAFDVETVNTFFERVLNFVERFSNARKSTLRGIAARSEHPIKFAAGNDIESRAFFSEQLENRATRICFDRVTDQMLEWRMRGSEPAVMIAN